MMGVGTIMMVLAMVIWICIETLEKEEKGYKSTKEIGLSENQKSGGLSL